MKAETDEEFTAYVAASALRLRRMAYLLCGDWQRAEDNVQVMPPRTLSTVVPTCAALNDAASGTGDGYHGPCSVQRLSDGSLLITRSGQTASGSSNMAQAILVRANGSGAFAEDTNAAAPTKQEIAKIKARGGNLPAGHGEPPVNSATLASLVRALASDTRS